MTKTRHEIDDCSDEGEILEKFHKLINTCVPSDSFPGQNEYRLCESGVSYKNNSFLLESNFLRTAFFSQLNFLSLFKNLIFF